MSRYSNSYKIISLFRFLLGFCDIFTIAAAVLLCFITWVVVKYIYPELIKRRKSSPENEAEKSEGTFVVDFRKQLFHLRSLSRKFTDDRKRLMQTLTQDPSILQKHCAEDLSLRQNSFLEDLSETMETINSYQSQRTREVLRTLEELKSDFSVVKKQVQYDMFLSSFSAFQPDSMGNNRDQGEKPSETLILNAIVMASEECFSKLQSEARTKRKEIIRTISRLVEQNEKDIRRELSIFSSAAKVSEMDRNEASISLVVSKVEKTEKNLLDTFGILNRQRFEMENLQKILDHFDGKFNFVVAKFDTFWNQSQLAFNNAAQRLQTIENRWASAGEKIDNASRHLIQQSKKLTYTIEDIQNIHNFRHQYGLFLSFVVGSKDSNANFDSSEEPLVSNMDDLNKKFEELLSSSEHMKSRLSSLAQSSNAVESLHDLIKFVAEGYVNFFSFISPSLELSYKGKVRRDHKKRSRFSSSCRGSWRPKKNNATPAKDELEVLWQELHQALRSDSRVINPDEVIFILKEIEKKTRGLDNYEMLRCGRESGSDRNVNGSDQWEDIPTETFLSEVSSNCLVQNSEDSEY